ncbi:MAG: hypothetical protein K2N23_05160, partial [Clostridia bacterium]|nr:hypothetical protein [Clostridia bacterium]
TTVMLFRKKIAEKLIILFLLIICVFSFTPVYASAQAEALYLGGFPAGFTLNTKLVEVIGICDVLTSDGMSSPARDSGIRNGDIIESINGRKVESAADINKIISDEYKKFEIVVVRNGENITLDIDPAKDLSTGSKRLGVLVKDTISGIGTVTYIDKANNKFASLGHPVADLKNNLIEINGGTVFNCLIYDVKKGAKGAPGELHGAFENNCVLGSAKINCACGIYGDLAKNYDTSKLVKIEKGRVEDVTVGKACIYTTLRGNSVKRYDISIVKTDKDNKDNRNYVIKIEDKELLAGAGGIVQGMSGSPIVQNGKLVGAVTHVFVNDPTRGYGISIDKMLSSY